MEQYQERIQRIYSDAERLARAGQWEEAASLLERCCNLTRFLSPNINSQWMIAADRAGQDYDAGASALSLACRAWQLKSINGALEFLQFALFKGARNQESAIQAGNLARQWPVLAAKDAIPPISHNHSRRPGTLRIGHLAGVLNPTHAPTKLIQALTNEIATEDAESRVYASEWAASWFQNWMHSRQSGPEEFLRAIKAPVHIHEAKGSFLERARALAVQIQQDDIDVLVVHAGISEMATSLTAVLRPARRLVSVNHATEMDLPCFNGAIHMFESGLLRSTRPEIAAAVIPPASDMDLRLKTAARLTKSQLQLPEASTLSGTFGNLYKINNAAYFESLRCILKMHPMHHHLIAGGGDESGIKNFLNEAGIADRVHLLGRRTDIPSLLLSLDFYLASHPYPGALSEIEAMAAACPVISVRNQPDSHYNAGAESVGIPECIVDPGDVASIAKLASRYLADADWKHMIGQKLKERFSRIFAPARIAAQHLEFYRSL